MTANAANLLPENNVIDVGVVIVTYNSEKVIGGLLDTLEDGLAGLDARVLVVDNKSSDCTVASVGAQDLDVIVLPSNQGYAAAINRGVRHFPGARSILVLNPDVSLTRGCVAELFAELSDARVGVVAPKMYVSLNPLTLEPSQRRDPSLLVTWTAALLGGRLSRRLALSEEVFEMDRYDKTCDVDWAVGAVLLISRACLDAVGNWDESFFLYSEETDYCRRARAAGFVIRYSPNAVVHHVGGGGHLEPRLRSMMVVNKVRDYRRRHGTTASWGFFVANVIREVTRAALGRAESRTAAIALLSPRRRPRELNASDSLLPG